MGPYNHDVTRGAATSGTRVLASPVLAIVLTVLLLLIAIPDGAARGPQIVVIQFFYCLLGGLAVLRPVLAGLVLGVTTTILMSISTFIGLAVLALVIPIAVSAILGHRIWALLFAGWYLGVSIAITAAVTLSAVELARGVNFWVVFMLTPLLLGEVIRQLQQRAEKQRKAQVIAADLQRRAIARDLHDTLTYATTTMVMRADQARLRGGHDEQTVSDLDFIAATGRSATADLRTMLAMLREPGGDLRDDPDPLGMLPACRLEEVLAAQAAKLQAFDFEVNLSTTGESTVMSERIATILARVVTEAASNITKHGDPNKEVTMMIDFGTHEVEAVFVNGIRSDEPDSGHHGMGLLGLREIVTKEDGSLTSEPVGGRWITHLTLPSGDEVRGADVGV